MWNQRQKLLPAIFSIGLLVTDSVVQAADVECRLAFPQQWSLAFLESGVVSQVVAKPGQQVKQGDSLISLDKRAFEADIQAAKARLSGAQMRLAEMRREWDRSQELYSRTLLSDHEKQLAENDMIEAASEKHAAVSALTLAKLAYEYSVIKAPADALVVNVSAMAGEVVNSRNHSVPVLELLDDTKVVANCLVSEKAIESYSTGQAVQVAVAGKWLDGVIEYISPIAVDQPDELFLPVQVRLPEKPQHMFAGMKAVMREKEK